MPVYPLKWRYKRVRARLEAMSQWATPGEAYVLTVFFAEKLIRRTLVQLVIRNGTTPDDAFQATQELRGIWKVKKAWKKYDPEGRSLDGVIGEANWDVVKTAAKYRNALVHGSEHQAQKVYSRHRRKLLKTLDDIRNKFSAEYGYSGWKNMRDSDGNPI